MNRSKGVSNFHLVGETEMRDALDLKVVACWVNNLQTLNGHAILQGFNIQLKAVALVVIEKELYSFRDFPPLKYIPNLFLKLFLWNRALLDEHHRPFEVLDV